MSVKLALPFEDIPSEILIKLDVSLCTAFMTKNAIQLNLPPLCHILFKVVYFIPVPALRSKTYHE